MVVVDDDPRGSAADVIREFASSFELGILTANTASSNISTARNMSLELGQEMAEWLAITDDDCQPDRDWISSLVELATTHDVDLVSGSSLGVVPADAPPWLSEQPFLDEYSDATSGADMSEVDLGSICNSMVSSDFLRRTGLRFRTAFGTIGGEDMMFMYDGKVLGMRHRRAARAIVHERLPIERCTFGYQVKRRFWYGNTEAVTAIASGRYSRSRMLLGGAKLVVLSLARAVARRVRRRPPCWRYEFAQTGRGLGRALGAIGIRIRHR